MIGICFLPESGGSGSTGGRVQGYCPFILERGGWSSSQLPYPALGGQERSRGCELYRAKNSCPCMRSFLESRCIHTQIQKAIGTIPLGLFYLSTFTKTHQMQSNGETICTIDHRFLLVIFLRKRLCTVCVCRWRTIFAKLFSDKRNSLQFPCKLHLG